MSCQMRAVECEMTACGIETFDSRALEYEKQAVQRCLGNFWMEAMPIQLMHRIAQVIVFVLSRGFLPSGGH